MVRRRTPGRQGAGGGGAQARHRLAAEQDGVDDGEGVVQHDPRRHEHQPPPAEVVHGP